MAQPHEEGSSLRESKEQLRTKAQELKEEVTSTAEEQVSRGKAQASGKAHAIASALRDAGDSLEQQGEDQLARWGRQTADQVERMASYFDRNDLSGLVEDLESTARSNTAAFVGGTFAAGLMLGRFLRASAPQPHDEDRDARTAMDPALPASERKEFA